MIENLIQHYKEIRRKHGHIDEIFKYEAVQHFQENWDVNAEDFAVMFKEAFKMQANLVYNLTLGTNNTIAKNYPEETKKLFESLYDESIDLSERIKSFEKEVDTLIKKYDPKLQGFQEERAISVYLTFRYPEKYTFFKDSYYSKYCALIGEKKARKGEKYIHYLKLIEELKEMYLMEDEELWVLTNETLPDSAWKDEECNILAQDVLYVGLDQFPEPNYWVFQGNPEIYDVVSSLRDMALKTWKIAAHKGKIKKGDKVILWLTGEKSGCYALCEIVSDVTKQIESTEELNYYLLKIENRLENRVEIKIEKNLWDKPILKEELLVSYH